MGGCKIFLNLEQFFSSQLFKTRALPPPPAKKCFYEEISDAESADEIKIYLAEPNSKIFL